LYLCRIKLNNGHEEVRDEVYNRSALLCAVKVVQAAWRGWKSRKEVKHLKESLKFEQENAEEREKAAIVIQVNK